MQYLQQNCSYLISLIYHFRDYFQMEAGRLDHREYLLNLGISNCLGCLDLDPRTFDWRAVHLASIYPSLNPLNISNGADRGCSSCRIIMAGFLGFGRDLSTLDTSHSIGLFNRRKHDSLRAMISHKGRSISVLEFYTLEEETASPWSIIGPKTHIPGDTASDTSFDRVQEWIHDCVQHHSKCGPGPQTRLPSRVLDLGTSNDSIKLHEAEGSIGRYICLSHCWGAIPTIVTTTETLEAYRENIPWVSLPAVFRNTINICRRLRIQYLWIDKLCIIQHDKEDWIREGSNMANIFENSFITLAASTAADDSGQFFVQMDVESSKVVELSGSTTGGKAYNIYARRPTRHYLDDDCPGSHTAANAPLLTRAWVFQERLLAPRVLHFGEELTWECREASYCECSGASHRLKIDHTTSLLSKSSDSTLHDQWRSLVMRFTSLRLTHEVDRLPALSGAAKQFQMRLRKRYLAGLWDDSLLEDLLWYAAPERGTEEQRYYTRRPSEWRSPSWSWASVEGPVQYIANTKAWTSGIEFNAVVTAAECISASADPTGAVLKGHLAIKGNITRALLRHKRSFPNQPSCSYTVTWGAGSNYQDESRVCIRSNFTVNGCAADVDFDLIEGGLVKPDSHMEVHCLRLASIQSPLRTFETSSRDYLVVPRLITWSLLLRKLEGENFERIGFLTSEYPIKAESESEVQSEERIIQLF